MPRIVSRVRSKVKHQLRRLRRRTADKGLAMRCQVVLLWAEGEGPGAVARAVGCSPSWVGRVVGRFRDHGVAGLHDRREDNGQVKLDEAFLASLYEVVDTQPTDHGFPRPTWTQELLVAVMADRTGTRAPPGDHEPGLEGDRGAAGPAQADRRVPVAGGGETPAVGRDPPGRGRGSGRARWPCTWTRSTST